MSELCSILVPILVSLQTFFNEFFGIISFLGFTGAMDFVTPISSIFGCTVP